MSFVNAYAMGGATYSEVERSIEVKNTGAKTTDTSDGLGGYIGTDLELIPFDSVLLMINVKF